MQLIQLLLQKTQNFQSLSRQLKLQQIHTQCFKLVVNPLLQLLQLLIQLIEDYLTPTTV